jgi:hypothetical protein
MIAILARVLAGISEGVFIKPAVREIIERERRPAYPKKAVRPEQAEVPQ